MIKASKLLCLICLVLIPAASVLKAQTAAEDSVATAADEAIRRQAYTISLRKDLVDAQNAVARKDLLSADKLYERCYDLVQRIGAGVEPEARQTIVGLTTVLTELAKISQDHHDYKAADIWLSRILVIDPHNQAALIAKRDNTKILDAQAGHIPSQEVIERIPSFRTNEIRIATMVQDGKLLYEAGKLDEAEEKLAEAYKEDPSNVAAAQYLQEIKQRRAADAIRQNGIAADSAMVDVETSWTKDARKRDLIARPNLFARTNSIHTGPGRERLMAKLNLIRMPSIKYDGLPLGEVINNLSEVARSRDPDRIGINFLVDREAPAAAPAGVGAIDPATGLPVAPLPTDQTDISSVTVKISPALTDVRLADVLDAIVKTSDKPIKYSVGEYAVVFSLRGPENTPLESRFFRVEPNTFRQGLESVTGIPFGDISSSSGGGGSGGGGGSSGGSSGDTVTTLVPQVSVTTGVSGGAQGGGGGGGGGAQGGGGSGSTTGLRYVTGTSNQTMELQIMARQFFQAVGVDLNTNNPANVGKAFVWNDRKGVLWVRATSTDLDIIEAAIQALNQSPPEVNIKTKFIEITQDDNQALGFNWYLGNVKLGGTVSSAGSQPSLNGSGPTLNDPVFGSFPGSFPAGTSILPSATDGLLTGGLRNLYGQQLNSTTPTVGTITGIFTDPQFRVAINALQQRDGIDVLTAPEVTTESGRQAQIQAVDIETIVTGVNVNTSSGSGVSGVANGVNSPIVQQVPTINFPVEALPFGPVLDVIPYVSADEYSIQMTLIPTITEFIGYDDPMQFVPSALVSGQTGNASITAVLPLPHFRVRSVTTSLSVWDAQTVVLGGLITDSVTKIKDKVPMLGDLPLLGRLFQSQSSSKSKKNLMIFVTPTIINPDGTRFHSDDEMPFAQNSTPPQKQIP